uniref:Uncharacterized protein n=1 Tax=Accipiter nisus TaxID=211598 RepID=A0A8B9MND5_9AVES
EGLHKVSVCLWYLIEQEAYKVSLESSLFFSGLLVGNITFGPVSDKLSRKPVCMSGKIVNRFFLSFHGFFVGIVNGGMALVHHFGLVYAGLLTNLTFAVGIAVYALLGYCVREWYKNPNKLTSSDFYFIFLISVIF